MQFNDSSTDSGFLGAGGVVSWLWDFGDGDSSPSQNPKHEYQKSGIYTVKLTVTDSSGGTHTVQRQVTITASLDGVWNGFIVDPGFVTDSFVLNFQHSATGGISGTVTWAGTVLNPTAISFNAVSKLVKFDLVALGIRLEGTLDASETRITGFWYIFGAPVQGNNWDVTLQ